MRKMLPHKGPLFLLSDLKSALGITMVGIAFLPFKLLWLSSKGKPPSLVWLNVVLTLNRAKSNSKNRTFVFILSHVFFSEKEERKPFLVVSFLNVFFVDGRVVGAFHYLYFIATG